MSHSAETSLRVISPGLQTWVSPFSRLHDGQNSCFRDHWPEDKTEKERKRDRYRGIFSFSPTDIQTHRHTTLPTIPLPSLPASTLRKYTWTGPVASKIMLGIFIFLPYLDCKCNWNSASVPNVLVKLLALLPEVPNSNLSSETDYPEVINLRPSKQMLW